MANNATDIRELNEIVNRESLFIEVIERELSKKIIGQRNGHRAYYRNNWFIKKSN